MTSLEFPDKLDRAQDEQKTRAQKDKAPRGEKKVSTGRQAPLKTRIETTIASAGLAVALKNETDGIAIIQGADRLATALDNAAKQNPKFRKTLENLLEAGVWTQVAAALAAILIPIAINHDAVPNAILRVVQRAQSEMSGDVLDFLQTDGAYVPSPNGDGDPIPE